MEVEEHDDETEDPLERYRRLAREGNKAKSEKQCSKKAGCRESKRRWRCYTGRQEEHSASGEEKGHEILGAWWHTSHLAYLCKLLGMGMLRHLHWCTLCTLGANYVVHVRMAARVMPMSHQAGYYCSHRSGLRTIPLYTRYLLCACVFLVLSYTASSFVQVCKWILIKWPECATYIMCL